MRHHLAAIAALLVIPSLPSPADAGHPPIILESYVGERPADAAKILSPFLDELATKKFVVGYEGAGRQFETASRPSVAGGLPADFADAVSQGYDLWTNGKFTEAAKRLGDLVEAARKNTGAFATEQGLFQHLQRAMIALSLSQLKLGDRSAARQAMEDALRGDPQLKISRGMYGQDAAELFEEISREMADSMGRLIVTVDAGGAGIFVNERLVAMNKISEDLPPGEYRVVALIGREPSRAYKVVVKPRDIHKLTIERAFDQAVHTGPDWTGFRFATADDRDGEAAHGAAFGNAIGADQVVVVGIDVERGRRSVSGALINKDSGREIRRAIVPAEAPAEQLRNLARYLAGAPATPDIIEVPPRDRSPARGVRAGAVADPGPKRSWGGWKWVTGGAAIAAGVAGGVILSYHGKCSADVASDVPCPNSYDTATQGWLTIGGAVALAGVTAYLVVSERRGGAGAGRTAYVAPTAGGAIAGYAARF
jgi:hypothetical protein